MKPEHGDYHYFEIAHLQFTCVYDKDFKPQGYWYPSATLHSSDYGIDVDKGFKTPEACEASIRKSVRKFCTTMLKDKK